MRDHFGAGDRARRVIDGVHGSSGSLRALRHGVSEARRRDAEGWSVLATA